MDNHSHERATDRRFLSAALTITTALLVVEVIGGIATGSLALIADGGHMASDVGALSLSLGALWLASRPATAGRTYGFHRAEILAAFVNSLALVLIALFVFWEAIQRIGDPPEVDAGPVLLIAILGAAANGTAAALLFSRSHHNLNLRSAMLHVGGDLLASIGVIIAALVILATGEYLADPLISIGIGVLILISSFRIIWETTQVLLEATPRGLSVDDVQRDMLGVPGVRSVHDLHVWTVTSGFISLSAHVEASAPRDPHDILLDLRKLLSRNFGISHATLQLETAALHEELETCCGVDTEEIEPRHAVHHY
jgi:cobalt-zinc-cadmium efflux system protein